MADEESVLETREKVSKECLNNFLNTSNKFILTCYYVFVFVGIAVELEVFLVRM